MSFDRAFVVPAITAGICATVAAAPPALGPTRGFLVDVAGSVEAGRPLLIAVGLAGPTDEASIAPTRVEAALLDHAGRLASRGVFRGRAGAHLTLGTLAVQGEGPWSLRLIGTGVSAAVQVFPRPATAAMPPENRPPDALDVAVEGGAIVPEQQAVVRVFAPGARAVRLASEREELVIVPTEAPVDGCGVASFHAMLAGLEAPVVITAVGNGEGEVRLRLPVDPGGLTASLRASMLHVEAVAGPVDVFAVMGQRGTTTRWVDATMNASDHGGTLDLPMIAGETWAFVSQEVAFDRGTGVRMAPPCPTACSPQDARARWRAWTEAPTPPRPLRRIYDGAARVAVIARRQRTAVRMAALELLALSIGAEIALVLRAALSRAEPTLEGLETRRGVRLRTVAAAIVLLLVAGLVLALRAVMEAAGE